MIQLALCGVSLKPGIQITNSFYQHHLTTVTSQDNRFRGFCLATALYHHSYCFRRRQAL